VNAKKRERASRIRIKMSGKNVLFSATQVRPHRCIASIALYFFRCPGHCSLILRT